MPGELNFQEILRQMNEKIREDHDTFTSDDHNPYKIKIANPEALLGGREPTPLESEMIHIIAQMDEYAWQRGKIGGIPTGFELFDKGIEGGLQTGLFLFAAQPNVGKSAVILQIAKQVAELNDNVYVAYFSLDDSLNELLPRYIACDQHIKISQAKMPEKYMDDPEIMEKRNEGLKKLYRSIHKFGMYDANHGTSVEAIEKKIKDLKMMLPEETKLIVFIDNFYDITVDSKNFQSDKAKYEYTADAVKNMTTRYDIPICCTAEVRKLNGNRRPIMDDLREAGKIAYEANWIGMLYNEVGIMEENAEVYWHLEDEDHKMPVIEMKFAKNKFGSFKGTLFYEFIPDYSYIVEASVEAGKRYAANIYHG